MNINTNNNTPVASISYLTHATPVMVSHNDIPGIKEAVTTVKACVFWRERLWTNGHTLPEYLTVFLLVPTNQFTKKPQFVGVGSYKNHPATNGVYIHIVGTTSHNVDESKKLILPRYLVTWTSYSKYLKEFGWKYLCSVGKYEGASIENLRCRAYTAIKRHRAPFYLEDAKFKTMIEGDYGILFRKVTMFMDDLWRIEVQDNWIARVQKAKLRDNLNFAVNQYSNFLWRYVPNKTWNSMKNHLSNVVKNYFTKTAPAIVTNDAMLEPIIKQLYTRLDEARKEIYYG